MSMTAFRLTVLVSALTVFSTAGIPVVNAQPPSYDEVEGARNVTLGEVANATNLEATDNLEDPKCEWSTIHETIWFRFVPATTMTAVARLRTLAGMDVEMAVFEVTPETSSLVACEDTGWEGEAENARFRAREGNQYYFMVGNATANQTGGSVAFDVHRPIRVTPKLDAMGWVATSNGNATITGRIRCSATRFISISGGLVQQRVGTDNEADGSARITCRKDRTIPWRIDTTLQEGPGFRPGAASVSVEFSEDEDEVNITRTQRTALVGCTKIGTLRNDFINGTRRNDRICGLYGDDTIVGRKGHDVIRGHNGSDQIDGGAGRDKVLGGDGPDRLAGGPARDLCKGGRGRDRLQTCEGRR
jgi:hypothetical protein